MLKTEGAWSISVAASQKALFYRRDFAALASQFLAMLWGQLWLVQLIQLSTFL